MTHDISDFRSATVQSKDGTSINYHMIGSGPPLVLVQGAFGNWYNYGELARLLASRFTVILPERRGRGLSPKPYSRTHDIARDVEDVESVLETVGGELIYGLSSGALIALEAARTLPRIRKLAVYEPPFYPNGISPESVRTFNAEIERGDLASAMVSAGRLVGVAPPPVKILPKALARLLTGFVIRNDARNGGAPYLTTAEMLPTMRYDFSDAEAMNAPGRMERLADIQIPTLLLSGDQSPKYLQQAIRRLKKLLPDAQLVVFRGLDHSGSWNADRGGKPAEVARAMLEFFGA